MNRFQLDECCNSRSLREKCNSAGHCEVRRYPRQLIGQKDPEMLPVLLAKEAPLVTTDRRIVDDHIQHIPFPHSGVILAKSQDTTRTMTVSSAEGLIERFKLSYPNWHSVDWSCQFLEIDETTAELHVIANGVLTTVGTSKFSDASFSANFSGLLEAARDIRVQVLFLPPPAQ